MKRGGPIVRRTPLRAGKPFGRRTPCESWARLGSGVQQVQRRGVKSRRETGFPRPVKLAVRARAGNGDIDQAACEACGAWVGRRHGQVHHRQNRQMGGSRLRNTVANAVLLCGTALTGCHGEATALSERMRHDGFVLLSADEPLIAPILLHGEQGGCLRWLTLGGGYDPAPPHLRDGWPA